jgi:hypothetical protein
MTPAINIKALPMGIYDVVPVYKGQRFPSDMMDAAYGPMDGDAFIAQNLATMTFPDFMRDNLNPKNAREVKTSMLWPGDTTERHLVFARGAFHRLRELIRERAGVISASKTYLDVVHRFDQLLGQVRAEMTPDRIEALKQQELEKLRGSALSSFPGTDDAAREANRAYQIQALLDRPKVLRRLVTQHVRDTAKQRFAEEKGYSEGTVAQLFSMTNRSSLANARRQVVKPFYNAYNRFFVPGQIRVDLGGEVVDRKTDEPKLAEIIPPRRRKRPRKS